MKPEKENLQAEILHRINILEQQMQEHSANLHLRTILAIEHSMYSEFAYLIDLFENRIGYEALQIEKYTPIKDYITKEPLKVGDKVKSNTSTANGILHFDDYTNQYVIKTEFGQHNKPSGFIKIIDNFDYHIDNSKSECRPQPNKKRW